MSKPLKEQNRRLIWSIIAANGLFFFAVVKANAILLDDLRSVFSDPEKLLPVGFAVIIATVLNGLLSADTKARVVFWRWHYALPGHRAFSQHALADPRVDPDALRKAVGDSLPVDPLEQNRTWYKLYKAVEKEPAVEQVHKDFLLLRDYAGLAALFVAFNGTVGLYAIPSRWVWAFYLVILVIQYLVVRQAAANYGNRMVSTVLAQHSVKSGQASKPRSPSTTSRRPSARRDP